MKYVVGSLPVTFIYPQVFQNFGWVCLLSLDSLGTVTADFIIMFKVACPFPLYNLGQSIFFLLKLTTPVQSQNCWALDWQYSCDTTLRHCDNHFSFVIGSTAIKSSEIK